jgi:hypothetical protein
MVERIVATPARYPFSFVVIGARVRGQTRRRTPSSPSCSVRQRSWARSPSSSRISATSPGPGTPERHKHYLELVAALSIPNVCLIGNHDLEHARAPEAWTASHGPRNFEFAYGNTRFVAIDGASGQTGDLGDTTPPDTAGPSVEALRFLDDTLAATSEPHRVVLLHAPPHLDGHYAPQPECGFRQGEPEFHDIIHRHDVKLVCCAHGLGFDHHVRDGTRFVMTGGGGAALYLSYRNTSRDRGALFHAVEITLTETAAVHGRVFQAFAPAGSAPPFTFGDWDALAPPWFRSLAFAHRA